jgi:hypothetical protein
MLSKQLEVDPVERLDLGAAVVDGVEQPVQNFPAARFAAVILGSVL